MRRAVVVIVLALLPPSLPADGICGDGTAPPLHFLDSPGGTRGRGVPALVVEAYYQALRSDEYVVIANLGPSALNLTAWSLTDGEGVLTFPVGSPAPPGATIVVAQNSTAYFEDAAHVATYWYGSGNVTAMDVSGSFRLNNAGDEVILRDPQGETVDVFAYGSSRYAGEGWVGPPALAVSTGFVARRARDTGWRDTNTSQDWDLERVWSLGQSAFGAAAFEFEGTVTVAATPDKALVTLSTLLARATSSIDASLYTFSALGLRDAILAAQLRGAHVRMLLEGAPVGGINEDEWSVIESASSAVEFRFMVDNSSLDIQERYAFAHAKYAILDGRTVVVSTENWGSSAFPMDDMAGSRGWLIAVDHAPLAAYFTRVFEEDFDPGRRDILTFEEMTFSLVPPPQTERRPREPRFLARSFDGRFRIVPVLGPDTTLDEDTILGALREGAKSIHVEMFYAHTAWGPFPNRYLDALIGAARRGVRIRLLLDASWFNADDDEELDNDDTALYMNTIAANEGLDMVAKLVKLEPHGFTQLHTKGFIVDGRNVLVSSVNWNRNSPTANREAGLLIESEPVAAFFEEVFAWDWKDDVTPPKADAGPDRSILVGEVASFSGADSSDDVDVTNYSWDLNGDGTFDAWGTEVARAYAHPGAFAIRLRVSDLWNNTAEDTSFITVGEPAPPDPKGPLAVVTITSAVACASLMFLLMRRRRKGLSKRR